MGLLCGLNNLKFLKVPYQISSASEEVITLIHKEKSEKYNQ
jgi:hypothetical protein